MYFSVFLCRWFHGNISREAAEQLLKPFKNGNFLVRESQNYKGDYTLCVWCVCMRVCVCACVCMSVCVCVCVCDVRELQWRLHMLGVCGV